MQTWKELAAQISEPVPPFGPEYPQLKGLEKYRRAGGLRAMDKFHVQQYGAAVEQAILALQATQLKGHCINRGEQRVNCASGTNYNTGEAIHEAVQQQQTAALYAYVAKVRRARSPDQWARMYWEAMPVKWQNSRSGRDYANRESD